MESVNSRETSRALLPRLKPEGIHDERTDLSAHTLSADESSDPV